MGSARSEQRLKQILAVPYGTKAKMRNAVYCERLKTIPLTAAKIGTLLSSFFVDGCRIVPRKILLKIFLGLALHTYLYGSDFTSSPTAKQIFLTAG